MSERGKLFGVIRGKEFLPIRGEHEGVPYLINKHDEERFVLNSLRLVIGLGFTGTPVAVLKVSDGWEGVFIEERIRDER